MRVAVLICLLHAGPALAAHPCAEGEARTIDPTTDRATLIWRGIETEADLPAGTFTAHVNPRDPDRYGRARVHLFDATGHVQERMLREGRALARPIREPDACAIALLEAERSARGAKRGLWAVDPTERASDPTLIDRTGRFAIVEGRVRSVGVRRRTIYLNFGPRWTTDFTAVLRRSDFRRAPELLAAVEAAEGRSVRLRGYLVSKGGPSMDVHDKAQIEWLDAR